MWLSNKNGFAEFTEKGMSANKAKQRFVFSRAPVLNSCYSLKADYRLLDNC